LIVSERTRDEVTRYLTHSSPLSQDSDGDGLTDFQELQNSSDPLRVDTDGDLISDSSEERGRQSAIEGKDPEFVGKITAFVTPRLGCVANTCIVVAWEMRLNYTVKDNAGLYFVRTNVIGERIYETYFGVGTKLADVRVIHEVSLLAWKAIVSGFDINVTVADVNGNGIFGEPHADSIVQAVLKALLAVFASFVQTIVDAASKLFEFVWELLNELLRAVLTPLFEAINDFIIELFGPIKHHFPFLEGAGEDPDGIMESILEGVYNSPFTFFMTMFFWLLDSLLAAAEVYTGGAIKAGVPIISTIIQKAFPALLGALLLTFVYLIFEEALFRAFGKPESPFFETGMGKAIFGVLKGFQTLTKNQDRLEARLLRGAKQTPARGWIKLGKVQLTLAMIGFLLAILALSFRGTEVAKVLTVIGFALTVIGVVLVFVGPKMVEISETYTLVIRISVIFFLLGGVYSLYKVFKP